MQPDFIAKYKILRLIGEGGMASVYEAEHALLGSRVAIKVLNPIFSINNAIRERFQNEARIMASLKHPNIVRVIDFDEQPQQLSIVMELLEGEDLNRRIRINGPLNEQELKSLFRQVLSALQYAHDEGIVHRDIKPSNIYLMLDGQVKILDFGIAKVYGQGNELTMTGQQMGTPVYMSPEQVRTEKTIDHRTDIYSLGVTMYFAATGKPPYDAGTESQFDILTKIVNETILALAGRALTNQMVQKACAKDPVKRFQQCREWLDMIEDPEYVRVRVEPTIISGDKTVVEFTDNSSSPKSIGAEHTHVQREFPEVRIGVPIIKEKILDQSPSSAYLLQFLFGLGFIRLKIDRKRSYFYIFFIAYSWFSFINIFWVDHGRGPFGGISFLFELQRFHNETSFGSNSILFGWIVGHIIGLFDLLETNKK